MERVQADGHAIADLPRSVACGVPYVRRLAFVPSQARWMASHHRPTIAKTLAPTASGPQALPRRIKLAKDGEMP